MKWLAKNLEDKSHKYILISHIYAGSRFNEKKEGLTWLEKYNDMFFSLTKKNKDQIMLEIGGHDHWEDLRYF